MDGGGRSNKYSCFLLHLHTASSSRVWTATTTFTAKEEAEIANSWRVQETRVDPGNMLCLLLLHGHGIPRKPLTTTPQRQIRGNRVRLVNAPKASPIPVKLTAHKGSGWGGCCWLWTAVVWTAAKYAIKATEGWGRKEQRGRNERENAATRKAQEVEKKNGCRCSL